MKPARSVDAFALLLLALACASCGVHAQTPGAPQRGVIRLKVRYKSGDVPKDLPRKRFFLIKGSLEENRGLIEKMKQTDLLSRECYYRSQGASEALIKWLKDNDCESVYCREIEERYVAGSAAVPEFQAAFNQARVEFKTTEVARRWLVSNLSTDLGAGFYSRTHPPASTLLPFEGLPSLDATFGVDVVAVPDSSSARR